MTAVLIVTGLLTAGAGIGLFAPQLLARMLFGAETNDPATILLIRHWSLLIALVGGLLVYAAYTPDARVPVMVVAVIEKFVLAALVLSGPLRKRRVVVMVVSADVVMALLYVYFLVSMHRS